jgi:hypothetical protein
MSNNYLEQHLVKTTASHAYYVFPCGDLFRVEFQPINKKTGAPWQALRSLKVGADRCLLTHREANSERLLEQANVPADWMTFEGGRYTGAMGGLFSTRDLTLAAIERHASKVATLDGGK